MGWLQSAYAQLSSNTIKRCWAKAAILPTMMQAALNQDIDRSLCRDKDPAVDALVDLLRHTTLEKKAVIEDLHAFEDDGDADVVDAIIAFDSHDVVCKADVYCQDVLDWMPDGANTEGGAVVVRSRGNDGPDAAPSAAEAGHLFLYVQRYFDAKTDQDCKTAACLQHIAMSIESDRVKLLMQSQICFEL